MLQLKKFPDIPVSSREEARDSRPHPEEPCFRLLAREEESFHCVVGKEFPAFPSHLRKRRSPQERREELPGLATIPRVPQMSQSIPGKTVFPRLPRLSSRGLTHTTVARGTSLGKGSWESLVGEPQGNGKDHLIHATGNVTLLESSGGKRTCMPPPETRTHSLWGHSRSTPRSISALERNPQVLAPTPHKVLGPGIDGRVKPERHPSNSHGDWPFLRPPERVPEIPVVSREHLSQLEKIQEVLPSRRDEAHFR